MHELAGAVGGFCIFQFHPARSGDCYDSGLKGLSESGSDFQFHPARSGDCYTPFRQKRALPGPSFNSTPREAGIATRRDRGPAGDDQGPFQFHPARSGDCYAGCGGASVLAFNFQFHPARSGDCYYPTVIIMSHRIPSFNSTPREAGIATYQQSQEQDPIPHFQFHPARSGDCYSALAFAGNDLHQLSIPPRAKRGLLRSLSDRPP